MKIFILMQDEPFYLFDEIKKLVAKKSIKIVGVVVLSQRLPNDSLWRLINRYLNIFGLLGFLKLGFKTLYLKLIKQRSLGAYFKEVGIPIISGDNINHPKFLEEVKNLQPDLLVSIACPQKIRDSLLEIPKLGAINLHGGYLPDFPGVFTPFWNLMSGNLEAGCTVHWVNSDIDSGEIITRIKFPISNQMSIMDIYSRISKHGISLLCETLDKIEFGHYEKIPNQHQINSYNSFPSKADRKLFRQKGFRSI